MRTHIETDKNKMKPFTSKTAIPALLVWLMALSALFCGSAAVAETTVRATVDRSQLSLDETFTLTLSADSITFSDEPDVSALQNDFHILRRQQSSRSNIINGKVSSSRQWDYTLAPKREGDIVIPALPMGKYQTRPLTVSVRAELKSQQRSIEQVFLESDVTPRSSYVQAQLDYTVKIFTSVNFLDASLDEPELDNAVIEKLGESRYQTQIDNRYYQVIERQYAIFPQTSGELEIPALTLQARVEGYRSSLLDPGRLVVKRSQSHRVRVSPPPADYQGSLWLPAQSLVLEENWSRGLDAIQVGDSLTRSVTITAQGLLGSQLPTLPELQVSGAKLYPDQAKIDKHLDSGMLTGLRTESLAIIPTRAGELVLPEIRIPWWNIVENRQEVAVLPERRLRVLPAINASGSSSAAPLTSPQASDHTSIAEASAPSVLAVDHAHTGFWLAIAGLTLLNLILTTVLWRNRHRKPASAPSTALHPGEQNEADAFKALRTAMKSKDPLAFRRALAHWAERYFGHPVPLALLAENIPAIAQQCQQLDACLYSKDTAQALSQQEMAALIASLDQWRKTAKASSKRQRNESALPPLYS